MTKAKPTMPHYVMRSGYRVLREVWMNIRLDDQFQSLIGFETAADARRGDCLTMRYVLARAPKKRAKLASAAKRMAKVKFVSGYK